MAATIPRKVVTFKRYEGDQSVVHGFMQTHSPIPSALFSRSFPAFNCPPLLSLCPHAHHRTSLLDWQEWNPTSFSAVVARPPLSCLRSVVKSVYLRYRSLSVSSDLSGHYPLTSLINKAFLSSELLLTGRFLFFTPFWLETVESVRVPGDERFQKNSNQLIWHRQSCYCQSHWDYPNPPSHDWLIGELHE